MASAGHRVLLAALGGVMLGLSGCGGAAAAPGAKPPGILFSADHTSITAGESVVLTWTATDATAVTLQPGAQILAATGALTLRPAATTTYTLTATGPGGTQQANVTITVTAPSLTASLTANPTTIALGKSSTLAWSTQNANTVTLNGTAMTGAGGTVNVTPSETTTYTLVATGWGGGTQQATVTVVVVPPPTISFTATPSTIQPGQSAVLAWQTSNATTITLDGTAVAASGSWTVSPSRTVYYDLIATGEGGTQKATVAVMVTAPADLAHAAIVVLQNKSYSTIIGNPDMPYLNSLVNQYAVAANYYANGTQGMPDSFMLTTGDTITNDPGFTGIVTQDNIARQLIRAGKTWKAYAESLPSVGYLGPSDYPYIKAHNPFVYFADVAESTTQRASVVPFTQFALDVAGGQLPTYLWIIPDNHNNGHDCPVGMAQCTLPEVLRNTDDWLRKNVGLLLGSDQFNSTGVLVITFDESDPDDTTNGGGHVPTIIVGAKVKRGYRSTNFYQHQSTLRLMMKTVGLTAYPAAAAVAPDMDEFFTAQP